MREKQNLTSAGLNVKIVDIACDICFLTEGESVKINCRQTFFKYSKLADSRDLKKYKNIHPPGLNSHVLV